MTPEGDILARVERGLPAGFLLSQESAVSFDRERFFLQFGSAGRVCGREAWIDQGAREDAGAGAGTAAPESLAWLLVGDLRRDEAGRVALLLDASTRLSPSAMHALAEDCFRHGDNAERRAVLRALSLVAEPVRYVELAAQACRSHVQTVFEALACENPYPAAFFPELNFNQMVLKALFVGAALTRVIGLGARVGPELVRMAADYAAERRAAGRSVPADIEAFLAKSGDGDSALRANPDANADQ